LLHYLVLKLETQFCFQTRSPQKPFQCQPLIYELHTVVENKCDNKFEEPITVGDDKNRQCRKL